ncbi:MAG: type II toxin-antitoxin system HicA family toxin [Ignavibacteriaceae bacterium]
MNKLNSKQKIIIENIFREPVQSNILWTDIIKVLTALGAEISEGSGSRVRIYLNGVRAVFHRPHPKKETDEGALKSMRKFLIEAGVKNAKA